MSRVPDPQLSRAVLIGTSDYERTDQLSNLPAVRNNLSGMENVLTDPLTGVFMPQYCIVVDSPDSPRSLMRRLIRAANTAEDVLLVYYAGHGTLDRNGDLHLAVRETDPDPYQLEGTAVPFSWIRGVIENSPAIIRVLIMDCCFSGKAIGAMSADSAAFQQIQIGGTYILTSSEATKVSRAVPGERYTAFTGELLTLLSGSPTDPPITLAELNRRLRAALARRDLPSPMSRADDTSGDLILRRQAEPVAVAPAQPAAVTVTRPSAETQLPRQEILPESTDEESEFLRPMHDETAVEHVTRASAADGDIYMHHYGGIPESKSRLPFRPFRHWTATELARERLDAVRMTLDFNLTRTRHGAYLRRAYLRQIVEGYSYNVLKIAWPISLCIVLLFSSIGIAVWLIAIIQGSYYGGTRIVAIILIVIAFAIIYGCITLLKKWIQHRRDR